MERFDRTYPKTGIIVRTKTFNTNLYDNLNLKEVPVQIGSLPKNAQDPQRGQEYKEKQTVGDTHLNIPKSPSKRNNAYQKGKIGNIPEEGRP